VGEAIEFLTFTPDLFTSLRATPAKPPLLWAVPPHCIGSGRCHVHVSDAIE
jgi:hypothetical protein